MHKDLEEIVFVSDEMGTQAAVGVFEEEKKVLIVNYCIALEPTGRLPGL